MDNTLTSFTQNLSAQNLMATLISFGWRVLSALIVLAIGYALMRIILSVLGSTLKRTVPDPTVRSYIQNATRIILFLLLVTTLLSVFGIQTASLAALIGAAGLAIGLALQGSLSNFAAGFMLLLFRPFRAGDQIEVAGVTGTVIEIGIFSTIIDMPDNVRAFVPNGSIFSGVIKNRSVNEYLRVEMKVTVAAESDISRIQQSIHRILATNDMILEIPRPEVQVVEDDSPGITIAIRPYAKLNNAESVRTLMAQQVYEMLQQSSVEVLKH